MSLIDDTLENALGACGFSHEAYLDLCESVSRAAGLGENSACLVANSLNEAYAQTRAQALYPVIWLEGASCSGCSESFAQLARPGIAAVVLEMLSLNYSDMLSAGAGLTLEQAKAKTVEQGSYLLIHEGAITLAFEGNSLRAEGKTGAQLLKDCAQNASCVIALGSCAVNGGWMAAAPNAAGAIGVQAYLSSENINTPVVNIAGCPANPEWLMSVLVRIVLMGGLANLWLDEQNRPQNLVCDTVHENCARRLHFERGEFVFELDSPEAHAGFCLYPLGCKGPQVHAQCGVSLWNNRQSWCVYAGAPCIACCDASPDTTSWVERNQGIYRTFRRIESVNVSDAAVANGFMELSGVRSFGWA